MIRLPAWVCFALYLLPAAVDAQTVTVTVVATTDVHGRVMHWDYVQDAEAPHGLSRVAALVDSIRASADGPVVVLDAGDLIQGNPFASFYAANRRNPHPVIDAMNAIGYDAITPGNHEFNFGLEVLERAYAQAEFPIVSGNVLDMFGQHAFDEYAVLERAGVRVGVTGFTTPGVMVWDRARVYGQRVVRPVLPQAEQALANLARAEADLKIAIIHSGMEGRASYDTTGVGAENVAAQLADLPTQPDLVIVGHSHRTFADSVIDGVHFMQPPQWARGVAVARIELARSGQQYRVRNITSETLSVSGVEPLRTFVRRLESPHADVREYLDEPIARSGGEWSARFARAEDTPIIDFVNETQRKRAGTQLSSTAAFNTAAVFPAGVIRRRDVIGVYPYENRLKGVRITGAQLREYLEHSSRIFLRQPTDGPVIDRSIPGYNYDMVSGVAYSIDVTQPVGSRIRGLSYQGRPVQDGDVFTMALNDYRQGGGGNFPMLAGLPVVYDGDDNIREILIEEVAQAQRLDSANFFTRSWNIIPNDAARAVKVAYGAPARIMANRTLARVLSLTDLRGALEPVITPWSEDKPVGGQVALVRAMDSLESACACVGLRVAAGDMLQGTLTSDASFGAEVVDMLNAAGTDVGVPGGADFTWGLDTLRARVEESEFPWLAADLVRRDGSGRPDWLDAWTIVQDGDVNIAVIGLAGDSLPGGAASAEVAAAVGFLDPLVAVNAALDELRTFAVDAIVLVAHLDAYCEADGCQGALIDLMQQIPPDQVDLVVGGHSDTEAAAVINGTPLVLPGSRGLSVGSTDLVVSPDGRRSVATEIATAWAESEVAVVPFVTTGPSELDAEVATIRFDILHTPGSQSGYGNLLADAYRNAARTQFAIVWTEDIGGGLTAGSWSAREIHRAQPSRRGLVRLQLRGDRLEELLEHLVADGAPGSHVSGLHVRVDLGRRAGDRVRRMSFPNGDRLRGNETYTVAVSDRLARGNLGFALPEGTEVEPVGLSDFEALVRYLGRLRGPVEAPADQRFISN